MDSFKELKDICKEKNIKVNELKRKMDIEIIRKDLKLLVNQIGSYDNPKPDQYINNDLEIRIDINNGLLDIIHKDKKKGSFLWTFGLDYKKINNFRLCDTFEYDKKHYSVSFMDETRNENLLFEIQRVINEYDESIKYLTENSDISTYKYEYYSSHEDKTCSDIFDLYKTVVNYRY